MRGKVQGVFFRKYTKAEADRLGLRGYVRNLEDGGVRCVAQGPEAAVARLEAFLHRGSPKARVQSVEAAPCAGPCAGPGFEIRRG